MKANMDENLPVVASVGVGIATYQMLSGNGNWDARAESKTARKSPPIGDDFVFIQETGLPSYVDFWRWHHESYLPFFIIKVIKHQ